MKTIPIFRPSIGDEEIDAVAEVLRSGWIGLGPKTDEFEKEFAKYIGTKYAVALNSCTAALHLAVAVLNMDHGEIITTPITFVSTAHAILYNNLTPVFADIQRDTVNINPRDIEKRINKDTRSIIPVHYGGHPCDMDEILDLARDHGLYVIEDAAHACGAEYKGKKTGSLGDMGCFSFHAVKNLATGDGGMITTNNEEIYQKLLKLRWLGINKGTYQRAGKGYSWYYEAEYLGFKMHMNDITAAIGLAQLKKLDRMNDRRREIVKMYNEAFEGIEWISTPVERDYIKSSLHNYAIKLVRGDRNDLIYHLADQGISAGVHYMPTYMHPVYKKLGVNADCSVADDVWRRLATLPLYPDMTDEDIGSVVESIKRFGS